MTAYYNEFDPNAAAWLRELIKQGLIADGIVDERSIIDVQANDLTGFTQCHFFAGIGGWSRSLRLANWHDDKPVWTASLPCQPFSSAGKQLGKSDERHLLPHFIELVKQCRPNTLFGEQVEAAIRHGWLDDLQAAMEAENYAVGHVILGAHSVQSFHQRQRLYWVANAINTRPQGRLSGRQDSQRQAINGHIGCDCTIDDRLGNTQCNGQSTNSLRPSIEQIETKGRMRESKRPSANCGVCNTQLCGCECKQNKRPARPFRKMAGTPESWLPISPSSARVNEWDNPNWLCCRDEKYRAIEPSIKPLVNGLPKGMVYSSDISAPTNPNETQEARVMRLKGYGNAIVPQVAAEFISAFIEITDL